MTPSPAKVSDKRYAEYARQYGTESWELDALRPNVLSELLSDAIKRCISDQDAWDSVLAAEAERRRPLAALHGRWNDVKAFLDKPPEPPKPELLEPDNYLWEPE